MLSLLPTICVNLSKLLNFSVPVFSPIKWGYEGEDYVFIPGIKYVLNKCQLALQLLPELTNNRSESARGSKSSHENAARRPVLTTCSTVTDAKALPAAALAVTYAGVPRWEGRAVLQDGEQTVSPHCGPPRTSPPNPLGAGPHWVCAHQHPTIGSGFPYIGGGPAHRPSTNLGWTGF